MVEGPKPAILPDEMRFKEGLSAMYQRRLALITGLTCKQKGGSRDMSPCGKTDTDNLTLLLQLTDTQ